MGKQNFVCQAKLFYQYSAKRSFKYIFYKCNHGVTQDRIKCQTSISKLIRLDWWNGNHDKIGLKELQIWIKYDLKYINLIIIKHNNISTMIKKLYSRNVKHDHRIKNLKIFTSGFILTNGCTLDRSNGFVNENQKTFVWNEYCLN